MKKIYMPDERGLYQMQEVIGGNNMYNYLLIKATEALIVDGINYPAKGILKNVYDYIKNDPAIVRMIGLLYPEEIKYSQVAMNDSQLCSMLLNDLEDKSIYGLDNLSRFSDEVNYDTAVIDRTIATLDDKLIDMPRYRFEYVESPLLESIFSCDERIIARSEPMLYELAGIEPGYALQLKDKCIDWKLMLLKGLTKYRERYGAFHYSGSEYEFETDILTNKDENVKRLVRTIYHDKNNLY